MVSGNTGARRVALALVAAGAAAMMALPAWADTGRAIANLHLTLDVAGNPGVTFVTGEDRDAVVDANTGFGDYLAEGSGSAGFGHLVFTEDLSAYAYAHSAPESFAYYMTHIEPGLIMTAMNTTSSAIDFKIVLSSDLFLDGYVVGPTGRATARAAYLFTGVNSAIPDDPDRFTNNIRIDLPAEGYGVDFPSHTHTTLIQTLLPGSRYTLTLNSSRVAAIASAGLVPEPETWTLLLCGFFGAGAIVRRRRLAGAA